MRTIRIPELDRSVARIGLGGLQLTSEDQDRSSRLMDLYASAGGNLVDTAEVYRNGRSEMAIGHYLQSRGTRQDWVIVTKACVEPSQVRPDYIRAAIPRSLDRLGLDSIDVFLLHRDDPTVPVGELLDVLSEMHRYGFVRAYGGSNWSVARLREANKIAHDRGCPRMSFSSPHLALATPREPTWADCTHATLRDLACYADDDICVLGWSAQARGFFTENPAHPSPDVRRVYHDKQNLARLARTQELAEKRGLRPVQVAIAWVLAQVGRTIALVGTPTPEELTVALGAADVELTPSEAHWLFAAGTLLGGFDE